MIFTKKIASAYVISLVAFIHYEGSLAEEVTSCVQISDKLVGTSSQSIILQPTSTQDPFGLEATYESPSLPFQTTNFDVKDLSIEAECLSNGQGVAPTCTWQVSLGFCDKGGACDSSDKSFRSGTLKAFGTGPTAYFIDGSSGTGSFANVYGSIDSTLNLTNFDLEDVQINICSNNVNYGDIIYLQNNLKDRRWLSGGRRTDGLRVHTFNQFAPPVFGGSNRPDDYESTTAAKSYEWIIRSTAGDGSRNTIDPQNGRCVKYGDKVHLQVNSKDNRWLTGGRTNGNEEAYTADKFAPSTITPGKPDDYESTTLSASYEWIIRSFTGTGNLNYKDTRAGQCLEVGGIVYLQVGRPENRWLSGGRKSGNIAVATLNQFEKSILFPDEDVGYERVEVGRSYQWIVLKDIGNGNRP